MSYPTMLWTWIWFLIVELLMLTVMLCGFCRDPCERFDTFLFGCCLSSCAGVILFPFLVVTWGLGGFLKLGLPFWILRCVCALGLLGAAARTGWKESDGTPLRVNSGSLTRGSSKTFQIDRIAHIIGRSRSNEASARGQELDARVRAA